jgi:hypothetical protein
MEKQNVKQNQNGDAMKNHKTSKSRTLRFQTLEDRSLMAGNHDNHHVGGLAANYGDFQWRSGSKQVLELQRAKCG